MKRRVLVVAVLLAAFLLSPIPGAAAETAQSLVSKHKAFAGFTYGDGNLPALDISEEVRGLKDGTLHATEHIKRAGGIYRTNSIDVKSGTGSSSGFTGKLFWYSDENGFTVPVVGEPAFLSLDLDLILTDAAGDLPWVIVGEAQFDGSRQTIARVSPKAAYPIDLYVDNATGAYNRAIIAPGTDVQETVLILKYAQPVPGKNVISKWRYTDDEQMRTVTSMKPYTTVDVQDLHPPVQTASWTALGATLPLKISKNRIVVNARVNGVEGRFLLDTGAFGILLNGGFARRAGLVATGHTSTYGFYEESKTDVGHAKTVQIGGNTLENSIVYFGPDDFGDSEAPDGLLGFDVFGGTYVTLDVEHSTLRIEDSSAIDEASLPGIHVATDLSSGRPVLPVRVADKVLVRGMLDTGTPQDMWLTPAIVNLFELRYYTLKRSDDCGRIDSISVGSFVMKQPQACEMLAPLRDAIVGLPFVKNFARITFDYPRALVTLVPRP